MVLTALTALACAAQTHASAALLCIRRSCIKPWAASNVHVRDVLRLRPRGTPQPAESRVPASPLRPGIATRRHPRHVPHADALVQGRRGGSRTCDANLQLAAEHLLTTCVSDAAIPALRAAVDLLTLPSAAPVQTVAGTTAAADEAATAPDAGGACGSLRRASSAPARSARLPDGQAGGFDVSGLPRTGRDAAQLAAQQAALTVRALSTAAPDPFDRPVIIRNFTGAAPAELASTCVSFAALDAQTAPQYPVDDYGLAHLE